MSQRVPLEATATGTGTNSRLVQACNAPGWVAAGWAQAQAQALAQFGGLLRKMCTYRCGAAVEAGRRRACMCCLQATI
jgi:hypothetical protein